MTAQTIDEKVTRRQYDQEKRQESSADQYPHEKTTEEGVDTSTRIQDKDKGTKDPVKGVKQRWAKLKAAQRKLKKPSKADVKQLVSSVTSPVFMLTLGLAFIKDLIDFFSLGWIGTIVNVGVTTAFVAILLFQGSSMKKMKKRWIRYGAAALVEFIPFVSILPFWSISVIWDKLSKK